MVVFSNSNRVDDDNGTASKYDLIKPNQHTNVPSIISYYFVINFCSVSSQSFALRMFVCPVMSLPSRLRSPVPERSFFSVPSVLSCFREIPDWRRCAPLCFLRTPRLFEGCTLLFIGRCDLLGDVGRIRTVKRHPLPIHAILHEEDCELFLRIRKMKMKMEMKLTYVTQRIATNLC